VGCRRREAGQTAAGVAAGDVPALAKGGAPHPAVGAGLVLPREHDSPRHSVRNLGRHLVAHRLSAAHTRRASTSKHPTTSPLTTQTTTPLYTTSSHSSPLRRSPNQPLLPSNVILTSSSPNTIRPVPRRPSTCNTPRGLQSEIRTSMIQHAQDVELLELRTEGAAVVRPRAGLEPHRIRPKSV
jgi:hypothetical protein